MMLENSFFSLPTFVWIITGLLMAGTLLPKLNGLFPRLSQSTCLWRAPLALVILAGGYAVALGAFHLASPSSQPEHAIWWRSIWAPGLPPLQLELALDSLAAFFLIFVGFFALLVAFYSLGALKAEHYQAYRAYIAGGYSLFVWGSLMTVLVYDVFSLLAVLEITTLAFTALTLFKGQVYRHGHLHGEAWQRQEARLAPKVYLIISHASTAFLLLGFLLLATSAHSLSFQALQAQAARGELTTFQNQAAFLLLLIGLGIRAGLTPAHIWPPLVHPASPTTTHAFSLGMGIKVALFLMIRVFFQLLNPVPWWGLLLFILAGITAFVNVWYAMSSHDLKTALAYHSIENVSIMTAGIGLSLYAYAHGESAILYPLASLALAAGLFHLINHAIFKSLLYLATGAIENLTHGQVDMTRLGGLLRLYPLTGLFFLAGAWAITGFPPFNGFISEWMTIKANIGIFIAYLSKNNAHDMLWRELFILLLGFLLLITSFALTAICFYKIAGLTLLGQRHHKEDAWEAHEVSSWMLIPMAFLTLSSLLIGLFPRPLHILLAQITNSLGLPASPPVGHPLTWSVTGTPSSPASWPGLMPWGIVLLLLTAWVSIPFWIMRRGQRKPLAWQGGVHEIPYMHMQTTGASLTWLIRKQLRYLSPTFLRKKATDPKRKNTYLPDYIPMADASSTAKAEIESKQTSQGVVELFRYGANLLIHQIFTRSERFARMVQNGDVRRYMAYIGVTYLGILVLHMIFSTLLK